MLQRFINTQLWNEAIVFKTPKHFDKSTPAPKINIKPQKKN